MPQPGADTADYASLFLGDLPLLDTRAPLEFARGAFPMATSIPLMDDDERAMVGICYKQQGQQAAIELGHQIVSGEVKEQRLRAWEAFAREHPEGYLYCWRGGLRSRTVQAWLAERGVHLPRVLGGYKAMRRFLLETLESEIGRASFCLVSGATGAGKTRLIRALPRAIDLEGLARHRGSAFGGLLVPQPSQIDFENALAIALLKLAQSPGPCILEDEGRLIGRIALPESLRQRMSEAPLLLLEYPLDERVEVVVEDYVVDLGEAYRAEFGAAGAGRHRERLLADLARTRKRLGSQRHAEIHAQMERGFELQARSGSLDGHRDWVARLLGEYYDPMYTYQLEQRQGRRLCRGRREELAAFVADWLSRDGH